MQKGKTTGTKSPSKKATKSTSRETPLSAVQFTSAKNEEVRVREVENGFVVSKSGTIGKGRNQQYYNKEFISPVNPLEIKTGVRFGAKKK